MQLHLGQVTLISLGRTFPSTRGEGTAMAQPPSISPSAPNINQKAVLPIRCLEGARLWLRRMVEPKLKPGAMGNLYKFNRQTDFCLGSFN